MEIWRSGEFAVEWFWPDRWGLKAGYDGGWTGADAPDGLIEDWWAMPWRHLQALGW